MYYQNEIKIGYTDCDEKDRMKLSAAMRCMQQSSSEHLEALNLPAARLFAENMVFLLVKMCIRVHHMPVCRQPIVVGTAPVGIRGVRFLREFTMESLAGERLLSALSLWVLADPRTHKILRPASFPYHLELHDSRLDGVIGDIPMPRQLGEGEQTRTDVQIRYSHLDVNRHVNNSFYGDFVCDALPYHALVAQGIETVAINFQNEARWGETLEITTHSLGEREYYIRGLHGASACFDAYATLGNAGADIK